MDFETGPTTIMGGSRKRSLSDAGPRAAEVFFGGRDQEMEKLTFGGNMGQGLSFMDSSDMNWMGEGMRDKFSHRGLNGVGGKDFTNSDPITTVMAMQYQNSSSPSNSSTSESSTSPNAAANVVDPSLIGNEQHSLNSYAMLNPSSSSNSPSVSGHSNIRNGNQHHRVGSVGASPISDPSNWVRSSASPAPPQAQRPSIPSQRRGGHKRGAQSEDLTTSFNQEGIEDFLAQITAPNGGLAPPGSGAGGRNQVAVSSTPSPSPSGGGHGRGAGASSPFHPSTSYHPYRPTSSHARHSSFGSNHSNHSSLKDELSDNGDFNPASIANMMMPPHPAHRRSASNTSNGSNGRGKALDSYNQTSLPTYGELVQDEIGRPGQQQHPASNYVNAKVTTEKTQKASAMRRKTEAMYACPVAGCSSTFTR